MIDYLCEGSDHPNINDKGALREKVVRCRDCEYFDTRKCKSQWPFCLDSFCWWGKRKEGGDGLDAS